MSLCRHQDIPLLVLPNSTSSRWLSMNSETSPTQIAKFMGPTWAHLGPVGPRWAPCWPHEPCYQGMPLGVTLLLSYYELAYNIACMLQSHHRILLYMQCILSWLGSFVTAFADRAMTHFILSSMIFSFDSPFCVCMTLPWEGWSVLNSQSYFDEMFLLHKALWMTSSCSQIISIPPLPCKDYHFVPWYQNSRKTIHVSIKITAIIQCNIHCRFAFCGPSPVAYNPHAHRVNLWNMNTNIRPWKDEIAVITLTGSLKERKSFKATFITDSAFTGQLFYAGNPRDHHVF